MRPAPTAARNAISRSRLTPRGQKEAGDVDAGNREQREHRHDQHLQRAARGAGDELRERNQVDRSTGIGVGILPAKISKDTGEVRLRLLPADACLQQAHGPHPVASATAFPTRIGVQRGIDRIPRRERKPVFC
jgi:hypothetical protein